MFIFLDTETTGKEAEDRLCQLAYKTETGTPVNELFNPGRPISVEAMSINHITNEMVKDKPSFKGTETWQELQELLRSENNILVAHNAQFDVEMLKKEDIAPQKFICTLKLARYLDKDGVIPLFNLQYLRYYLGLNVEAQPHSAIGDIMVLEALFQRIHAKAVDEFGDETTEKMVEISKSPVLIRRMPFGKHKGQKMDKVPRDYLEWLLTTDLDEDLEYSVKHYQGL